MTKEQLKDRIAELTKGGRRLSDAEVLELGRAHKSLPKGERDWAWLAAQMGWAGDGEVLRQKVKRLLRAERAAGGEAPSEAPSEASETAEDRTRALLKERQRLRDERSEYARLVRDDARIEALKDSIAEAASKVAPLPAVLPSFGGEPLEAEAVALFSDLHIGVEMDDYCNKYDLGVAKERVAKWAAKVVGHCRRLGVKRLNVLNLGDLIQGLIHVTIRLQQQFDVATQVIEAGELLADALNAVQEAAPQVVYRSCTDNHSRMVADKTQAVEKENLGRIIDWYVKERLKGTSVIFKEDNLTPDLGRFKLMNGKTAMFSHGHLDQKNRVFQNYVGATKEFVDYIFLGHYHAGEQKTFQHCTLFVNGSIVGPDQYARDNRMFGDPSQKLLVFDGDDVIDIDLGLR